MSMEVRLGGQLLGGADPVLDLVETETGGSLGTVLEIPVPEADALAMTIRSRYNPDRAMPNLRGGAAFAHISVAGAFPRTDSLEPELLAALTRLCAGVERFRYDLRELRSFPGAVLYLTPEPEQPFRDLMAKSIQHLSRGSAELMLSRSTPHVTVAYEAGSRQRVEEIYALVRQYFPIRAEAREAHLVSVELGARTLLHRFPFGSPDRVSL